MKKLFFLLCTVFLFSGTYAQLTDLTTVFNENKLVGHWEFKNALNPGQATKGEPIVLNGGAAYQVVDGVGSVRIEKDPANGYTNYLSINHNLTSDDASTFKRNYCLLMDAKLDLDQNYTALYRFGSEDDADIFARGTGVTGTAVVGSIGLNGGGLGYSPELAQAGWNRIIVNAKLDNGNISSMSIYVVYPDGTVKSYERNGTITTPDRFSINIAQEIMVAGDNDRENGNLNISRLALFNDYLTEAELNDLMTNPYPTLSSADNSNETWYYINGLRGAGVWTDPGEGERLDCFPPIEGLEDGQLWKFIGTDYTDLKLVNKLGRTLSYNGSVDRYYMATGEPMVVQLDKNTKEFPGYPQYSVFAIKYKEGTGHVDKANQDTGYDKWSSTTGDGTAVVFELPENLETVENPMSSTEETKWFTIQFSNGKVLEANNETLSQADPVENNQNQYWKFSGTLANLKVINYNGKVLTFNNAANSITLVNEENAEAFKLEYYGEPKGWRIKIKDTTKQVTDKQWYLNSGDGTTATLKGLRVDGCLITLNKARVDVQEPEPVDIYSGAPKLSTNNEGPWYFIQVKGSDVRADLTMTADTLHTDETNFVNIVRGKTFNMHQDTIDSQLWRFEKDNTGVYTIINKATNQKLDQYKTARFTRNVLALSDSVSNNFTLQEAPDPNGRWVFQVKDPITATYSYLHQGNSGYTFAVIFETSQWGTGDNSQFTFVEYNDIMAIPSVAGFGTKNINTTNEQTIQIATTDAVTAPITYTLNGEGFTVDDTNLANGSIKVTFAPITPYQEYKATITLTSGDYSCVIPLTGTSTPVIERPTISNAENGDVWYYVNWHRAGAGKSLTDFGLDEYVKNTTINPENNRNQIWKLSETETADRFNLEGLSGHFINSSTDKIKPSETAETAYQLVDNTSWGTDIPIAFSLFTGSGTTALDHVNSGDLKDGISTWSGEGGVSKGAAVTFMIAPSDIYTDETEVDFGLVSFKNGETGSDTLQVIPVNIPSYTSATATITGDDAAAFAIATEGDITNEIALTFTPGEEKVYEATLTVTAGNYSTTVSLKGEGLGSPRVNTDKDALVFGNVTVNKKKVIALAVTGINLEGEISYTMGGDNAADFVIDNSDWNAAEGGNLVFTITPAAKQEYSATITFTTPGAESTKVVELTATGVDVNVPFEFSPADGEAKWYYIFSERGNAYLEDKGVGTAIETNVSTGADNQLWKFVETEYSDKYLIINKTGNTLAYNATAVEGGVAADRFMTVADTTFTYGVFTHTNEGFWQILCNEIGTAGSYINKLNGNLLFGAYSVSNDAGASVKFIPQEEVTTYAFPKISEGDNEFWYYIQFNSNSELVVEDKGMGEAMKAATKNHVDGANQLWKVIGTAGNYQLVSKANPTAHVLMVDSAFVGGNPEVKQRGFVVTDTVQAGTLFQISVSSVGCLTIVPHGQTTGFNPFGGAQVGNYIGLYNVTDPNTQVLFKEWGDASLSALAVDNGTLTPAFSSTVYAYNVTVPGTTTSINVTATATDSEATIVGNGSHDLTVGDNTIEVSVTSPSGANTLKYTITVTRESSDATLKSISINRGTLTPAFDPDIKEYTVIVPVETANLILMATPNEASATVEGTGYKTLNLGKNEFTITVTAQDKVTKEFYVVTVDRTDVGVNNPQDKEIIISSENGILTASFEGTKEIQLFSATGTAIDKATATATYTKPLNKGIYVLVIDGTPYKTIVK
ncbi:MAG: cadherin-like beta sandwich domain-containing protein [Bacteroidales bacterium]|nr:cadherin-like beta sandwich domain-containing protein [Bacteroidales bacterium]